MPLPDIDELDAAYEAGRAAEPYTSNPYFFGTALWAQWGYGYNDNLNRRIENTESRTKSVLCLCACMLLAAPAIIWLLETLL